MFFGLCGIKSACSYFAMASWVVAIPSFDRVEGIKKKTLDLLLSGGVSPDQIFVFADPDQFKAYQDELKS